MSTSNTTQPITASAIEAPTLAALQAAKQGLQLVHVVAMDSHNCIGVNNTLPWHLPADLQHFKNITQGGVIAMGRKTFDSLGRLLPKRTHVVLSNNSAWQHDGVIATHSLLALVSNAATAAKAQGHTAFYVIGGGQLYTATLAIADVLHITHVQVDVQGDTHYPPLNPNNWQASKQPMLSDPTTGLNYTFAQYRRS